MTQSVNASGRRFGSSDGSVLVIVLVIMAVTMALTMYIVGRTRQTVGNAELLLDKLEAKLEAESQLEILKFYLTTSPFAESVVQVPAALDLAGEGLQLPLTGEAVTLGATRVSLRDTASLLPVTQLGDKQLQRLVVAAGGSLPQGTALADNYRDWTDKDNLKRLNGAEEYHYRFSRGYGFSPRNSLGIQAVEELQLIRGFDAAGLLKRLADSLVLYGSGAFNVNTADAMMLGVVLDIPSDQARQLVAIRDSQGPLDYRLLSAVTGKDFTDMYLGISTMPGRKVAIYLHSKFGGAEEKLYALIDCQPGNQRPYKVLRYQQ